MTTIIERDMTVPEVAKALGMHYRRAQALLRSGQVPTVWVTDGGQLRVQPSGLARWLEERSNAPT